ncbi:uncharacterized protein LOC126901013 [Daktulosphaira vitifoliae]|uniref:uncharacterized protein LOC126901013 n=1 Tax=Daktulosphaira vitifoliae TaxID=58002 RepID=UPI0021AABF8C|nr:uncharacterized protein LOC126901013 [Daktulosphaira vitifoliae]
MSGDVRLDVKNIEFTTTQILDIDIENVVAVGGVFTVIEKSGDEKIAMESMDIQEDANKLCTSHIITEEDHQNNCTPELKIACKEGLLTVKQESDNDKIAMESMDIQEDANKLCTSHIITEEDHQNNCTPELKIACKEGLLTVKQESDNDKIAMESMDIQEDANKLCTSHIITEENHQNNCVPELEVTATQEVVFMETGKQEGVIRHFGKNNKAGRIISKNGKCYKFYKKDIVGSYKYYKSPQKAEFAVDDSQANWAKDVEIVGNIYGQRCYYCLMYGHYTEECIRLDIDSLKFYYPYI